MEGGRKDNGWRSCAVHADEGKTTGVKLLGLSSKRCGVEFGTDERRNKGQESSRNEGWRRRSQCIMRPHAR